MPLPPATEPPPPAVTAIVLCGGASRRMGGNDKTALPFGSATVLDHLLDALPADWPVVCVGEARHTARSVTWTRESPPGGGPVAGMAAGLALIATPLVVLVAGDMPFAGPAAASLAASLAVVAEDPAPRGVELAATRIDGVVGVDGAGRVQPLLGAYRADALRRALPDDPAGARLMGVIDQLDLGHQVVDENASLDVDTPEALERARRTARRP